jgi:small-conductance mechanosensitive channel
MLRHKSETAANAHMPSITAPAARPATGHTGARRERPSWAWLAALLCCVCATLAAPAVLAATAAGQPDASVQIPENLTPEQARDLIARLTDEQVRQIVISQLEKNAAPKTETDPSAYVSQVRTGIKVAAERFESMIHSGRRLAGIPDRVWRQLTEDGRVGGWLLLAQLLGLLLAAWAGDRLVGRLLTRSDTSSIDRSLSKRIDLAVYAILTGLARLGAFAAGAALFIALACRQTPVAQDFWFGLLGALLLTKLVWLLVRNVVSPADFDNRLVPVSAAAARRILAWSTILAAFLFFTDPIVRVATGNGADADMVLMLAFLSGGIFVALILALIVRLRRYGASLILRRDGDNGPIRQAFARSWWALACVYVLLVWFLSVGRRAATGESSLFPGLASLFLVAMIPYFDLGLKSLIGWYFSDNSQQPASKDDAAGGDEPNGGAAAANNAGSLQGRETAGAGESAVSRRTPAYIAIALRYARIIMALCILMLFLRLWDIDLRALSAQLVGPQFASALFDISITVLLTWALWGMIRISIERKLDEGKPAGADGEGESEAGGLGGSRVETVLPLIRIFIKITLIVMAVLISLSALGVNIGPLIAGAGVVGIAIGFGAQTLVRDIVSGFFYLLDDAFRIGEYVVIDQIRGTVEKISIRSFQLRHHEGPVHTIPYGEIRTLTNWSRDWAIMKFELRVPFETDIEKVRKIIKQIGIDMQADPVFGPLMLAPLKSQGVNRMDDSALIIRCKFTAIPGQQYLIRREAFTRIQRVFEEKGIHFAPRRVLVEATTPAEAAKAAAASLDQESSNDKPKDSM